MSDFLDDIDVAVRFLVDGDDPGAKRIGLALENWRRDRTVSFENALGHENGARRELRRKRRDAALRRIAAQLEGSSAQQILNAVRKYRALCWPDDKKTLVRPDGFAGDCYDVMRNGGPPSARRQLYRILAV